MSTNQQVMYLAKTANRIDDATISENVLKDEA